MRMETRAYDGLSEHLGHLMNRREFLTTSGLFVGALPVAQANTDSLRVIQKSIPADGSKIPAIGMGTWQSFDVSGGSDIADRCAVLAAFFAAGGRLIDSSPMYGSSPDIL